jgi:hypothetical protein
MIKLSRTKLELFLDCPRCFWLDMKQGVKRPPPAPYTINSAIDMLLKDEFDVYRGRGTPHPLMERFHIDAVPYKSDKLNSWRHNFTGVQFHHAATDFLVFGAVDDIWVDPRGELIVVDYKATGAKEHHIYSGYKRQMEVYQWLLLRNGFSVARTGYFLFSRVNKEGGFAGRLSFDFFIEPQDGDVSWIEGALRACRNAYDSAIPDFSPECPHCLFTQGKPSQSKFR